MPSIKTKYGTVINTSGLSPEQVAKVRQVAEGKGAYGSKGAALANTFRKQAKKSPATPPPGTPGQPEIGIGVDPTTGAVDPSRLLEVAGQRWNDEQAGKLRTDAQNAAYNFTTKDYAADKANEIEAAKQEAAMRGIPYDPGNPNSAYGRNIESIDRKYRDLDYQAKNLALSQGNEIYQTEVGAKQNAFDSFINAALGMSSAELNKYGIDQNTMLQLKQLKQQKYLANKQMSMRGGGGAAPAEQGDIILNSGFGV